MSQSKDKTYYLDWIVRAHQEGCQRLGRDLSQEAEAALREIWDEVAQGLEKDPRIFRLRRSAAAFVLAEAGELMARSAQFGGQPAVEARHVCAGTVGLHELGRGEILITDDMCDWICPRDPAPTEQQMFRPMGTLLERTRRLQDRDSIRPT